MLCSRNSQETMMVVQSDFKTSREKNGFSVYLIPHKSFIQLRFIRSSKFRFFLTSNCFASIIKKTLIFNMIMFDTWFDLHFKLKK